MLLKQTLSFASIMVAPN